MRGGRSHEQGETAADSLVGSYAQPEWLIDRKKLAGRFPPRVRALELWRVPPEFLEEAQDDATLLAIRDQERAGLDIITDGEMRRESYSNRFATALDGVDIDNPGTALDRSGHPNPVPRVVGKIRRKHPVEVRDVEFLRANTDRRIKMTVPGPFTMSQQAQNDFYDERRSWRSTTPPRSTRRSRTCSPPAPTSSRSTSPTCRRGPRRRANSASRRSTGRSKASRARRSCISASAMPRSSTSARRAIRSCPNSPAARAAAVSIETAQSSLDCSVLETLPDKKIILGVLDLST
jgi:5-methyltetrahydropteroyltriglutamate--homocysteine methyltransferase